MYPPKYSISKDRRKIIERKLKKDITCTLGKSYIWPILKAIWAE